MKHQKQGVKFLKSVDGIGALLYDPGTGKTGTALTWIDKQARKHGEFRVLVVAPLTAADTWVLQPPNFMDSMVKSRMLSGSALDVLNKIPLARDWSTVPKMPIQVDHVGKRLDQRVTILSMSAGLLSSYCSDRTRNVRVVRAIRKYAPHLIIVDESHIIKAPDSNISAIMYQLGQLVPHRIILTGTVNPLSLLDCYGQWRFLAPWTFSDQADEPFVKKPLEMTQREAASIRPWAWGRFTKRYSKTDGYRGKEHVGFNNEIDLRNRVAERSQVVNKKDALDLPPYADVDVHVTLTPAEEKAYTQMAIELLAELESGELLEAPNALAKMMKLRQIAAGFIKDTETEEIHDIGSSLRKGIKEVVTTQLAAEDRVVVFLYFKHEIALFAEELRKAEKRAGRKTIVEVITGDTKPKERLAIRGRFGDVSGNPKRTILVAQARTMSLSVNELVSASHAVYGSLSERRDDWVQSRDRLYRKGQEKPVTFWNVFAPDHIGEIMRDRHLANGDMEKALLDHIKSFRR
jgi:hypothetical protein